MTRRTETIDLEAEAERLDQELDELADEAAAADSDSDEYEELREQARALEQQLVGVKWALNPSPDEGRERVESVTIGEVLTGDYARVEDRSRDVQRQRVGRGEDSSVSGAQRVFFVAAGLQDADFLDAGADFDAKARAVNQLAPQFTTFLEDRIDDLSTPDVDVGNFEARVAEKQTQS
jgi:hypothetical protein